MACVGFSIGGGGGLCEARVESRLGREIGLCHCAESMTRGGKAASLLEREVKSSLRLVSPVSSRTGEQTWRQESHWIETQTLRVEV